MCGVIGYAGPPCFRAALLAQSLLLSGQRRGHHSTGYALAMGRSSTLVKRAVSAVAFVRARHTRPLFANRWTLLIGHNRFATSGRVTDRNSHPFRVRMRNGRLAYGAHNGCLPSAELARRFGVAQADVDSETLFRAIARRASEDSEDSILEAISRVSTVAAAGSGDLAILWMVPSTAAIYGWRTDDRPLVVIDARAVRMGRWFCSEWAIFAEAWGSLGGLLPSIKRVRGFAARPGVIYRVESDGEFEVDAVARFSLPAPRPEAVLRAAIESGTCDPDTDLPGQMRSIAQPGLWKEGPCSGSESVA